MLGLLARLRGESDAPGACDCRPEFDGDRLLVDATDCPKDGKLHASPPCRAAVIEALTARDAESVVTRTAGIERAYEDDAAALLVAAGRFADAVRFRDERLAERALRDPLGAAQEATGRAGPARRLAAETGLAEGAASASDYESALAPYVGPTVSRSRIAARPPADARLVSKRTLETDADARVYESSDDGVRTYHVAPVEQRFDEETAEVLAAAWERLATSDDETGQRAPGRAVRAVATPDDPVEELRAVLAKHARGFGVLEDLFADERVSDVFASAPIEATPLWVRVDGASMRTNVRLTRAGAEALASRFRRTSGRAFSQATPTLDATVTAGDRTLRVAGVTDPVSEGTSFAFRAQDGDPFTLPALVANGTLTARAGALLSIAVERGAAGLVAGPRGAGKTTLLGALLWEIPPGTRTIVIEDTPELPVRAVQRTGRDAQSLRSSLDDDGPSPAETLRTALRLGRGALVVGEIRGEEAGTLYEAMRVGANDGAVLGTIHGADGAAVRERVVSDLDVPLSSFGATDLLVSVEAAETADGTERRVRAIEEVCSGVDVDFAPLFERTAEGLVPTGRIDRGNSELLAALAGPESDYAALREQLQSRAAWLRDLVAEGRTDPEGVERARATADIGPGADGDPDPTER